MSQPHKAVAGNLTTEVKLARELVVVLQEEQSQLLSTSIDDLESLVARKTALVAELSQQTKKRNENLRLAGYEPNFAGMTAWLESSKNHPDAIRLEKSWSELVSISQSAKELNRLNGMLISSHMIRNQQALSILQGSRPNEGMYGPDGQPSRVTTSPLRSVVTG